jgi:NhaA family Na+:H+ antiporter
MSKGRKVINLMQEFSLPLILGVIISLIWANLGHESYHEFLHHNLFGIKHFNFHFLFNDIFMVFFFGIAAVEITQSVLPGGDLNPMSKAVNPLMATAGGVLGPIGIFFLLNSIMGSSELTNGWEYQRLRILP